MTFQKRGMTAGMTLDRQLPLNLQPRQWVWLPLHATGHAIPGIPASSTASRQSPSSKGQHEIEAPKFGLLGRGAEEPRHKLLAVAANHGPSRLHAPINSAPRSIPTSSTRDGLLAGKWRSRPKRDIRPVICQRPPLGNSVRPAAARLGLRAKSLLRRY